MTITYGSDVLTDGSILVVGERVVGTASNANFSIDVGAVPCLRAVAVCGVLGIRSYRDHGVAGELFLDLNVNGGIEPRFGGVQKLEIDLNDASLFEGGVTVDCTPTAYTGTATHTGTVTGTATITFAPGLPDGTKCTITLDCGGHMCTRTLEGDSNLDGSSNPVDNNQRLLRFGQAANGTDPEWDVNIDGTINPVDNNQTLLRFGNSAPACP